MNAATPAIPQSFLVVWSKNWTILCFQLDYDIIKIKICPTHNLTIVYNLNYQLKK